MHLLKSVLYQPGNQCLVYQISHEFDTLLLAQSASKDAWHFHQDCHQLEQPTVEDQRRS
jgi:hypothetical protein